VIEFFDFTPYTVSKKGEEELKLISDKPVIEIDYKGEVVSRNKNLYDTLVRP
jgi:hypothetical protein